MLTKKYEIQKYNWYLAVHIVVLLESLISVVSVLLEVLEKSVTSGVVGARCNIQDSRCGFDISFKFFTQSYLLIISLMMAIMGGFFRLLVGKGDIFSVKSGRQI